MQRIRAAYILLFLGAVTGTERATALQRIATVPEVSGARDVALWGDVALVGCSTWTPGADFYNSGLHRIDITVPIVPVLQTPSPLHDSPYNSTRMSAVDEIDVASGVAVLAANRFSYERNFGWLDLSRENPTFLDDWGGWAIDCFPPYYCRFETHDLVVAGSFTLRVNAVYSGEIHGEEYDNSSSLSVCQFGKPPQECTERYQFSSSHDHFFTGVDGAGDFIFLAGSIRPDLPKGLHILRWMNGEVELVSSIETGGDARKVRVKGDFAYIADGHGGLKVVDWSDPYRPRMVGEVMFPGDAINLTLGDDLLVVTSGEDGVTLIDVVDPTLPLVMSRFDTPGYAYGAAIDGRYIYVADGQTGLVVLRNWLNVRPSPTPTPMPPESYDIAPGSGDGKVDAVDLMEWLARVRGEQLQPPPLFGFSLQWGGQTD